MAFNSQALSKASAMLLALDEPSMFRSAPARKPDFLPEVRTAPLMSSLLMKSSTNALKSFISASFQTFIDWPGRSIVTSAMPSLSMSTVNVS